MRTPAKRNKIIQDLIEITRPDSKVYDINDTEIKGFMLRVRPSGEKAYYFRYRNATGQSRTLKIADTKQWTARKARTEAIKLWGAIKAGNDPQAAKQETRNKIKLDKESPTLRTFLADRYHDYLTMHHKSPEKSYKHITSTFKSLLDMKLKSITTSDILAWQADRLKEGRSKSTVDRDLTAIRAAFSRAMEWGLINSNSLAKIKKFNPDNRIIRFLNEDEEGRLLKALDERETRIRQERKSGNQWRIDRGYETLPKFGAFTDHLKPAVILSLHTGIRKGELFKLDWRYVDFKHLLLTVSAATAKSDQTRHIPLSMTAIKTLEDWRMQTEGVGLVYPGKDGKPLQDLKTAWSKLLIDADIKSFRWHDMRHHFASKLVMRGVDLNTVRELLGHSDIKMTLRYAHLAPEHKRAAIAQAFG